jgi:putative inorganic carbon (HCO3(-)) transporter
MVMLTLITMVLYCLSNEKKYFWLSVFFFIGLCLASSTGPFLGYLLAHIFFLLVFFKKINIKKYLFITVLFIGLFFTVDKTVVFVHEFKFNNKVEAEYNVKKELINSITNIQNNEFGNGRLRIWLNTIPIAKEYFWIGCGIDNFANVYPQSGYLVYDKAHNIYLQMLVTNGIFALCAYCAVCLIIFLKGFKFKKAFQIALFISFVGYCVQAFANISVIDVAPIFFIILGLMYTYVLGKKDVKVVIKQIK